MRASCGLFIVFEGGDGVGKTTQVDRLVNWLEVTGHDVVRTFEPGDSLVGKAIRSIVLDPQTGDLASRAEALLYAADKAQHVATVVEPALRRGAIVVCDRYVDSMLAYQGAGRVLKLPEVEQLARWATDDLRPHLTILLDVDPAEAVSAKEDKDRLEDAGAAFHLRVRHHFLALAEADADHVLLLRARDQRGSIAAAIRERVAELLCQQDVTGEKLSEQPVKLES